MIGKSLFPVMLAYTALFNNTTKPKNTSIKWVDTIDVEKEYLLMISGKKRFKSWQKKALTNCYMELNQ